MGWPNTSRVETARLFIENDNNRLCEPRRDLSVFFILGLHKKARARGSARARANLARAKMTRANLARANLAR
jgi:hypothetical protein